MRNSTPATVPLIALSLAWASAPATAAGQGSFRTLEELPGATVSRALAVTPDGATAVGYCHVAGEAHACRWTALGGVEDLWIGEATDLSDDGAVVVGQRGSFPGVATRWTAATGAVDLPGLGAAESRALAVSADGAVIVGVSGASAFRWTAAGGAQDLGPGTAHDVSADGAVVVGSTGPGGELSGTAFRWTAATGSLPLVSGWATARAVSGDGRVVYGHTFSTAPVTIGEARAFCWTEAAGWVDLGLPAQTWTYGTNFDGSVLVGGAWSAALQRTVAFRWTAGGGRVDLVGFPSDELAFDVSADGSVIVGGLSHGYVWRSSAFGERFCAPVPNSTGRGGLIDVNGSDLAQANDLRLSAEFLPLGGYGCFLVSSDVGATYPVSHSEGRLCLGGFIGRFVGPGQVLNAGAAGGFSLTVDLGALPTPFGPVAALPGDTWSFQAWHRDAHPTPTSNFTDAVRVTLR